MKENNIKIIKNYQNSIKSSLNDENYFSAMSTVLIMPDVCSSIEYANIKEVGIRYKKWLDKYLIPLISTESDNVKKYLNSANIYALRCTLLHIGSANASLQNNYSKYVDVEAQFDELVPFLNTVNFDKVAPLDSYILETQSSKLSVMLDVHFFCELVINAMDKWLTSNSDLNDKVIDLFSIAYVSKPDDQSMMFFRI